MLKVALRSRARAPRQRSGPRAYEDFTEGVAVDVLQAYLQACKPWSTSTYLYMAVASTNRSLRVFALISTGGTASSSLHAAFNQNPPSQRHLKRVKGSEGVCLWLPCAPLFADLANQSGHLHRNCHDCSPCKSGTMCAAPTHSVRLQVEGSISVAGDFVRGLTSNVCEQYYMLQLDSRWTILSETRITLCPSGLGPLFASQTTATLEVRLFART